MINLTQIKICGLTRREDVQKVVSCGFCTLGFILYKKSPRYIEPEQVRQITAGLSPFVRRVGVLVNEEIENIQRYRQNQWFDIFQLHGDESPAYCQTLVKKNIPFFKAFRVDENFDFLRLKQFPCNLFLLDTADSDLYGGTGKTWDWSILQSSDRQYKIILAGGLSPENIEKASQIGRADAYDLSSGLEKKPGVKSHEKIQKLYNLIQNNHSQ